MELDTGVGAAGEAVDGGAAGLFAHGFFVFVRADRGAMPAVFPQTKDEVTQTADPR